MTVLGDDPPPGHEVYTAPNQAGAGVSVGVNGVVVYEHGDHYFAPLLTWLRTNVHQFGRKFKPQELVERVTGSRIDPEPYLQYLESKYRAIYGL